MLPIPDISAVGTTKQSVRAINYFPFSLYSKFPKAIVIA
jgi:hypothetical protein